MLCRLCICDCGKSSVELLDTSGQKTSVYIVAEKYFEKQLHNVGQIKTEMDRDSGSEVRICTSHVICSTCWRHIDDFHQWQKGVLDLQEELEKLLPPPCQREFVKLEMEMEINELGMFAASLGGEICDNNDYFDEATEDPVAVCETKLEMSQEKIPTSCDSNDAPDAAAISDGSDDLPLLARICRTQDKAATSKKRRKRTNSNGVEKKISKAEVNTCKVEGAAPLPEGGKEKNQAPNNSSKTKEFDAFIAEHFKERLPCELCEHLSTNFTELRAHFRDVHNIDNGYVLCCEHKYSQRFHLVEHLQVHLNPQKFQCHECGKCSANGRSLVTHIKSMHGPKPLDRCYECEVCHKKFAKKPILRTHMETHAEGNPDHICKECGKGFVLESRLNIHIRNVHSTAYLSVCDQCGKSFRGRYALKYHLLEHEGAGKRTWPCDQCGAQLHSKFSLGRHKRLAHHDGSTLYVCSECGKVSLTEDALKSHKRYVHQKERVHKCNVCGKGFKASKVLKEHMTTHTGEDLYQCPHCPRTFKVSANMHHHRKRKHPKEWAENRRQRQLSIKRVDLSAISNEVVM